MLPENFKSHPVFEKLEQLNQVLIIEDSKDKIGIDNFSFYEAAQHYIKDKLKVTIPLLVQEGELSNLASEIESTTSQINSFLGNNNSGHLSNAINNLYSALSRIKNLPFPSSKGDFDFSKSIANFQQTVTDNYKILNDLSSKTQQDLAAVQENLTAKQNQIADIERKLAAKETEIQNVLTSYNTEYTNLRTIVNANIEADRKKFESSIEVDRNNYLQQYETQIEDFKKAFDELSRNTQNSSTDLINKLNGKLDEAKTIVNIIGNVGVTGNYQNIANQNRNNANFWRWVAVFFMILMSGLLIWSIIELGNADFNLYKSLVRIIAAAVLTYPAIYAARESTKHRNLETKNRNIELELASIGPFIELLPEDKKEKIKEELVAKYFGNHEMVSSVSKEDEEVPISVFEKILKAVLPIIKK